jgi:hypothetical protein
MTDKEKIRKEIVKLQKKLSFGSDIDDACILELQNVLTYIDSLQEESKFKVGQYLKQGDTIVRILEVSDDGYHCDSAFIPFSAQNQWKLVEKPISEFPNTESMIESYRQRLISQVNGMKNSPLIDMCLTSYKHGINETLDTLNLSNVKRTVKNCKDPVSKGRDIFDNCLKSEEKFILPQKISGNINRENCLYSSACALGDIQACIIDKPVSEDLEEASKKWLIPKLDKSYTIYGEEKMMELTRFDGYAMLDAIVFGANWQKQQDAKY